MKNLIVWIMILVSFSSHAVNFEFNGLEYFLNVKNKTAIAIGVKELPSDGNLVIPKETQFQNQTLPVVGIGGTGFKNKSIKSVTIPNSIERIGNYTFLGCNKLVKVDLPNSLKEIGDGAFEDCISLKSIDFPTSLLYIGREAFSGCKSFNEIVIPANITTINDYAFQGCSNLHRVIFLDGEEKLEIEDEIFREDYALTDVYIGRYISGFIPITMFGSPNIEKITIGKEVKFLDCIKLGLCHKLKEIVSLNPVPPTVQLGRGDNITDNQYLEVKVLVPRGTLNVYKENKFWSRFWNIDEIQTTPN